MPREYKANVTSQISSEIGSCGWERPGRWPSCHRGGVRQATSPRKTWRTVSQSALNPSTHRSPISQHLSPPLIPIGLLHFRFFFKKRNNLKKKTTKKKKKLNVFNSRYQNRFCKTWTAWHSFNFHYSPFNLRNQEDKFGFSLKIYFPTERCRTSSFIQSVQSLIHDSRVKSYCENMK